MVKINENEVLLSRHELFVLIGTAGIAAIRNDHHSIKFPDPIAFTRKIYELVAGHIWDDKQLPDKSINYLTDVITPKEEETKPKEFHEDKPAICALLLAMLQKTRAYHDLKDLKYSSFDGTVAEFKNGGMRRINTIADSGIAMINDILAHL